MSTSQYFLDPAPSPLSDAALESSNADRVNRLEADVANIREKLDGFIDLMSAQVQLLRTRNPEPSSSDIRTPAVDSPPVELSAKRHPWLLTEFLRDMGTTCRMYLDPRYRIRRATQIVVPLLLALFALNIFVFNAVFILPIVSDALERIIAVVLAMILYKVLGRELLRYRQELIRIDALAESQSKQSIVVFSSGEPPYRDMDLE
jgi:hypothetical protein